MDLSSIFWDLPAYLLLILLAFIILIAFDFFRKKSTWHSKAKKPFLVQIAYDYFWIVLIVFILRAFLVEPFRIPSGSMLPNLLIGDFVLVNKSAYHVNLPLFNFPIARFSEVKRGDVVVFRYPRDPDIPFIKRVVGLPGDTIQYKYKSLYINGGMIANVFENSYPENKDLALYQEYLNTKPIKILKQGTLSQSFNINDLILQQGIQIPQGQYFVMGDNRDNSNDSRYWGFVPERNILGKAVLVWMNLTSDGAILTTDFNQIIKFFTTLNITFDSTGKIKTGSETE